MSEDTKTETTPTPSWVKAHKKEKNKLEEVVPSIDFGLS